ncbi:MAG: site-specific integrase [Pseudomonadota bacterium]
MASIEKRQSDKGKITYRVLIRLKGHPTQSATFERLTDAREWERNTESAIKERRHFKSAESKKHTVTDMINRYLKRLETHNPRRYKDVQSSFAWWKKELGHCVLADLTKALITEKIEKMAAQKMILKDGREKPLSPARVNRHIAAFSHACTMAVNDWEWLEQHPMNKISKMKEPRGRVRFLDDDERKRLVNACQQSKCPCLYTVVILALSTGARSNEIMSLTWSAVDLNRKSITLHDTKNKERRVLPLTGHALELMKEHKKVQRMDSDLVFPAPHNPKKPYIIRTAWDTAVKKAGLEDFRFHDLRHSAASYLAMNGASLAEIAEVLGHKTLSMVKRYAHLSEAHTHGVVASMNEKIFGK